MGHQFLVALSGTNPIVWRRIQVPGNYTFWDLHVAIQDAMGWLDCHLHEFAVVHPKTGRLHRFGIPDDEDPDARRADWRVHVSTYVDYTGLPFLYLYDFGDDWRHVVVYEGPVQLVGDARSPRCVGGARRCPPEDCGGVHSYEGFLEAISNPDHEEHEEYLTWVGGSFDPDEFDPATVRFDDPKKRWKVAFADEEPV